MKTVLQNNLQHFNKVCFYVVAHADDWQLFMQPNVYNDFVSPGCKVVIIIVTAGDSGRSSIFWKAREEGSKSSVGYALASLGGFVEYGGTKDCNTHSIVYSTINNVTSYFLRLPDGNLNANGFAAYNSESLKKLKGNEIGLIHSIDGSTVYKSWADLSLTLESIVADESEAIDTISVHYPNPDAERNNGDHIDHIMVGAIVQNISILSKAEQFLYKGYSVGSGAEALQPAELFWKIGMFVAYEKTVYDICGYSTLAEDPLIYTNWCTAKANFETVPPALP